MATLPSTQLHCFEFLFTFLILNHFNGTSVVVEEIANVKQNNNALKMNQQLLQYMIDFYWDQNAFITIKAWAGKQP